MGLCHIKSRHLISSCVFHLSWWTCSLRKPAEHEELTLRALCQSCGKDRSGSCRRTKTPKGRATPFSSGEENLAEEMVPHHPYRGWLWNTLHSFIGSQVQLAAAYHTVKKIPPNGETQN